MACNAAPARSRFLALTLTLAVSSALSASAQIEVNTNGKLGSGTASPTTGIQLSVASTVATTLQVQNNHNLTAYEYGLKALVSTASGLANYPVQGTASSSTNNYGVYGNATGGSVTYGIYGISASASSSNRAGYFGGNVYATGTVTDLSDGRFKRDVSEIGADVKAAFMSLKPSAYRFASTTELVAAGLPGATLSVGRHFGLIAQDVRPVIPEVVSDEMLTIPTEEGSTVLDPVSTFGVNYKELLPILIAVLQDQKTEIRSLTAALRSAGIDLPNNIGGN